MGSLKTDVLEIVDYTKRRPLAAQFNHILTLIPEVCYATVLNYFAEKEITSQKCPRQESAYENCNNSENHEFEILEIKYQS